MKKAVFLVLILLVGMQAFPQVLQHLSLGYNSFYDGSWNNTIYYFYGYEGYSEGIIWHQGNVALSTSEPGFYVPTYDGYPLSAQYEKYQGQNNSTGYSAFLGATDYQGIEYTFDAGELVYWAHTMNFKPFAIMNSYEQTEA